MASGTIPFNDGNYYGAHTFRMVGIATATDTVVGIIPLLNPNGKTPTVTVNSVAIPGFSGVTGSVDTSRTNKDAIGISFVRAAGGFTVNSTYFCYVSLSLA